VRSAAAAERFVDYIAQKSYTVTLAVNLGPIKIRSGLRPGGIRLSLGLEDWHDSIADLEDAREVV